MAECDECGEEFESHESGLCEACRAERDSYYEGAICGRCNVDLDSDGYCENDRCPFSSRHQDEGVPFRLVDDDELNYIRTVVMPRLTGGQREPGDRS